jgi:hypothetical protein
MQRSIEVWVSQTAGQITSDIRLWAEYYPLPVGEAAARRLYARSERRYPDELTGLLPFRGEEEAYWGLRVGGNRSVVDMFGLKGPTSEERLRLGGFAYSLRGSDDTSLMRLVENGATWWRDFSWENVQGRPRGSGTWQSEDEFKSKLRATVGKLRVQGGRVTQENVADLLCCDIRTLQRGIAVYGINWKDVRAI